MRNPKWKTLATGVKLEEHAAVAFLARRHNLTIGQYVRAIVIDALHDEGLDVQLFRTEGCAEQGKASEASGRSAP